MAGLLIGCPTAAPAPGDDDDSVDDDDDDSAGDDDDSAGGPVVPVAGGWSWGTAIVFTANTCGYSLNELPPVLTLSDAGSGAWQVDFQTSGVPVLDCSLAEAILSCPENSMDDDLSSSGLDAIVTTRVSLETTFSSSVMGSADISWDLSCAGTQCLYAQSELGVYTLPCGSEFTLSISL